MNVYTDINLNPYSNTPIKNLEFIQNKALVIAPFEITKSGLIDTDLMLDTPGFITMYFFRKNFNNLLKEPTAEQFKVVGTVSDISTKLGLDISASNNSSSSSSSYYLGFTKISVIFKYDKNTGIRTIEKDNSLLGEDYIDIDIDNTIDLTTEDYFVICNVTKNTKVTNSSFTESSSMDFLFMIPSDECQELITDFDILDANNKTINIKKYETLGSGLVVNNDITFEPAYEADFFGDGSNIATYLFDGTARDLNGNYNGTTTGVTYGGGKVGQAAVFNGTGTFRSKINLSGYTSYTMSAWVKKPTTTSTFSMGQGVNATGPRCELLWYQDGYLYAECGSGHNKFNKYLPPVNDTNWHHILYTFNNGITNMYFDGVLLSLVSSSGTLSTTVPIFTNEDFIIGLRYNISIVSHVDQVRIFNRALNQNEVTALYLNSISTRVIKQESNVVTDNWTQIQLETVESNDATSASKTITLKDPKLKDFFGDKSTVANYQLDGDTKDETGFYDGVKTGTPSFVAGVNNTCLKVDANSNVISSIPATIAQKDFSISMWIMDTDLAAIQKSPWFLGTLVPATGKGFTAYHTIPNTIGIDLYNGQTYETPALTIQNKFIHVTWVLSNTTLANWTAKIYINGINQTLTQTRTSAAIPNITDSNFGLNGYDASGGRSNFSIDNVKIFNRALTQDEVTSLYKEKYLAPITLTPQTEVIASEPDFFNDKSNIATYLFDNNVNDANGKYNGTATNIIYGVGKFGTGINIPTSNGDFKVDTGITLNTFAISMWFKRVNLTDFINLCNFPTATHKLYLYGSTNGSKIAIGRHAISETLSTTTITDLNWHHITMNYDFTTSKATIYVDGVVTSINNTTIANMIITPSQITLFAGSTAGCFDNVRIFNRSLTASEVQDLYRETKRIKYKAIMLDETNFGPASKFSIETQKEIKLLNYKTWTGTDSTKQGYRIYPVMKIQDHTAEETSFSPKYYLGTKYQRNLSEILSQGIKSKRTISNLKDMYLVDDLCIQTLKKINILLENDQMIKFSERLYNLAIPLREKLNADLILEYLSTPVSGSSNSDIADILKTSLMEDYNFTQDEIDNLNDNLNTFKSRARIALNAPVIQGSGLDQLRFNLPKTFIDNNRSQTEKKNLLVFGTDAGFNKFNLAGYTAPYSNISKREESLDYTSLVAGLPNMSSKYSKPVVDDKTFMMYSGSLTDATGKRPTLTGGSLSTTAKKFNDSSIYINNSFITIPVGANLSIGTKDFTVETWINPTSIDVPIFTLGLNQSQCCFEVLLLNGAVLFRAGSGGWSWNLTSDRITASNLVKANTWNHIVTQRRNGNLEIYINGILYYTGVWAYNIPNGTNLYIGGYVGGSNITAYYDDISISNGVGRYTSNFTPEVSNGFKDILTNYKQQIPFTYIPLSTDIKDINDKPVFETLTDITGFYKSEIIIDIPNVL